MNRYNDEWEAGQAITAKRLNDISTALKQLTSEIINVIDDNQETNTQQQANENIGLKNKLNHMIKIATGESNEDLDFDKILINASTNNGNKSDIILTLNDYFSKNKEYSNKHTFYSGDIITKADEQNNNKIYQFINKINWTDNIEWRNVIPYIKQYFLGDELQSLKAFAKWIISDYMQVMKRQAQARFTNKNLFNPLTVNRHMDINQENGQLIYSARFDTTDFIEVDLSKLIGIGCYKFRTDSTDTKKYYAIDSAGIEKLTCYNENKEFLVCYVKTQQTPIPNPYEFDSTNQQQSAIKYIRLTYSNLNMYNNSDIIILQAARNQWPNTVSNSIAYQTPYYYAFKLQERINTLELQVNHIENFLTSKFGAEFTGEAAQTSDQEIIP